MSDIVYNIEDIVYKLNQGRKEKKPGAIVFLGAGASFTGEIPLAARIVDDIKDRFESKPTVRRYMNELAAVNEGKGDAEKLKPDYYELMQRLDADEIKDLFKEYVAKSKLNVAHIYLASMINAGYVDYVVTVNFDNLVQRSLALYDIFPSVHDLTTIKEKVTDTIESPAVIHVHGQFNGNWQLNKVGELGKVKEMMQNVFAKISQNRTWIVVGYSGDDPVFDTVFSSTKFDKNLYWICFKDQAPSQAVQEKLLNKVELNACRVNGYDADSFFLKLHNELRIDEPSIYRNPFAVLEKYLSNINDISGDEFKVVSERLKISTKRVKDAISLFNSDLENEISIDKNYQSSITSDNYALKLSEIVSSKNFDKISELHKEIVANGMEDQLRVNLGNAYFSWGYELGEMKESRNAIEKYKQTLALIPNDSSALHNWGSMLNNLEDYEGAVEKYLQAIKEYGNEPMFYRNLGLSYFRLNRFDDSTTALNKAIEMNPNYKEAYYDLGNLQAKQEKYENALENLQKVIELDSSFTLAYNLSGYCLVKLNKLSEAVSILLRGEAVREGSCLYNLAAAYSLEGNVDACLLSLEKLLKNEATYGYTISRGSLENEADFSNVKTLPAFGKLMDTYKPVKS
ncbi:MAG: tetratricopeptide repeat protein [Ferruginibacter sp.]